MADMCWEAKDMDELAAVLTGLAKKRSIIKQAIARTVQHCMEWVSSTEDEVQRLCLINVLRSITEGKIYVECERAKVTRILAEIKENKEGDVKGAADIMQEVLVETFSSMSKREKVDFILEQIRLCLAVGEYQKALIISRKVNAKTFENADFEDLKLRYLTLMIQLAVHDARYLDCCKYYRAIYATKGIAGDVERVASALKLAVIFSVLAKQDREQAEVMADLFQEKGMESISLYRNFMRTFLTREIVRWPIVEAAFGGELRSFAPHLFGEDGESQVRWRDLCSRVIERNVRTIASFYTEITMVRFATLLDQSPERAEETLASLITSKMIHAKMDRPLGVIRFAKEKDAAETLNTWNDRVDALLALMVKTGHMIAKDEMIHAGSASSGRAAQKAENLA